FLVYTTPPPALYTLSLHDALPIYGAASLQSAHSFDLESAVALNARAADDRFAAVGKADERFALAVVVRRPDDERRLLPGYTARVDRKSTRLNSSHVAISYAVFCLK